MTLSDNSGRPLLEATWSTPNSLTPATWAAAGGLACSAQFDRWAESFCHLKKARMQSWIYSKTCCVDDKKFTSSYGRVTTTTCGSATVEQAFNNKDVNLHTRSVCNRQSVKFMYENHELPREVIMASGRKLTYIYDSLGGLEQVMLPQGGRHSFWQQQHLHARKLSHLLPGSTDPYSTYWDADGHLLQLRPPGNNGIVVHRYNADGQPTIIVAGDRNTDFQYNRHGLLAHVEHERGILIRTSIGYDQAIVTDVRIKFNAKSALADAKFSYDRDRNLNVKRTRGRIGGQPIPRVGLYQGGESWVGGGDSGDFTLTLESLNGSVLTDGKVRFSRGDSYLTLAIDNKEVFRAEYVFNECNKIKEGKMLLKRSSGFFKQSKRYSYDDDGQLLEVRENSHVWKYDYDANGNMVKLLFGKNEHLFSYDDWDQLIRYNQAVLSYDSLGRIVKNYKQQQFSFGSNSLLTRVATARGSRGNWAVRYFYDEQNRLVGRKDSGGNLTQFHYARLEKPMLVTHVYNPREGKLTSLVYDDQDRLIYAQVNQDKYYVVCDQVLAPFLFFNTEGELVKEVSRSPYGHVTYDSFPSLHIPIGIFGGLEDEGTGLVHIQEESGRRTVYDPFVGAFLTPSWQKMEDQLYRPELFLLYRIQANDPVNLLSRRSADDFRRQQKTTLSLLSHPFPLFSEEKTLTMVGLPSSQSFLDHEMIPGLSFATSRQLGLARALEFPRAALTPTNSALLSTKTHPTFILSYKEPPFGNFIVLSKQHKKEVEVFSGEGANQIYQNVLTSVLNGSSIVDFQTSSHGLDSFYFTKPESWRASDDIAQLRRLGSKVNLTVHENQFDATKTMDVKMHMISGTVINIRYGTEVGRERGRLLRHAARLIGKRAWGEEQRKLQRGEKTATR